ncbi:Crp/Fnr family transcriptional regulator [Salinicola sp. MH3R3-1]|uniref:Crp/Fnr family transcriptional regulator n=1 Tax=Salinicola sp. MH3R3-1 TaxID=1928762 RepID=UPI00094F00B3|nr:Crp/Fnr family transcriptional regulator [Salinicola sp. MH3R3-1]OLO09751.1 Crp/Fnr family transcriptional regulator [Salinicola sp. MH3R3-1]
MSVAPPTSITNHLLGCLPNNERSSVLEQCEAVELAFGSVLCESDCSFRYLYFPTTCFISLVTTLGGNHPLELGLIGNEGMLGATLALGVNTASCRAVVQGPGTALRMRATRLRRILCDNQMLKRILKHYLYVQLTQLAQNAACAHFHEIEPRLARWLLMTQDRAHADHFHLTHEFLADMLGVRRSGITLAAGALQSRKLIRYRRGNITVLDRRGLEMAACECYDALLKDHARLFPSHTPLPAREGSRLKRGQDETQAAD